MKPIFIQGQIVETLYGKTEIVEVNFSRKFCNTSLGEVAFVYIQNYVTYYIDAIEESDCKYRLKGFPVEVVKRMVENQYLQGNFPDIQVLCNDPSNCKDRKGFTWEESLEGQEFWAEVINNHNFPLFFEQYPNRDTPVLEYKHTKTLVNEVKLRRKKSITCSGNIPEGSNIYGKKSKTSIRSGCFSYSRVTGH